MQLVLAQTGLFTMEGQASDGELALSILLPLALGYGIYLFFRARERDGGSTRAKWWGMLPLLIGAIWGLRYLLFISDAANRTIISAGRRVVILHSSVFFIMLAAILILFIWSWVDRRMADS